MTRHRSTALAAFAGLALLLGAPGHAADAPALAFLTPADVEPTHLLPPPPVDGSTQARDELAELRHVARQEAQAATSVGIGGLARPGVVANAEWAEQLVLGPGGHGLAGGNTEDGAEEQRQPRVVFECGARFGICRCIEHESNRIG